MTRPIVLCVLNATLFGLFFSLRVGGADMPITISLLNSLSGVAGSIAGMAISDVFLVAVGGIVGASGLLLTQIMCRAMNRSLMSILDRNGTQTASCDQQSTFLPTTINEQLVKRVMDLEKKIKELEELVKNLEGRVQSLTAQVEEAEQQKGTVEPAPAAEEKPTAAAVLSRPRTSSSCRATAWHWHRPSTRCASWPTCLKVAVPPCATPSTPLPVACLAT